MLSIKARRLFGAALFRVHKIFTVADIKNVHWVYIVLAAALLLIAPIFLKAYLFYDKDAKKVYFLLTIDKLSLIGGYGEKVKEGIALHLSEKKAVIVSLRSLVGMRSQFNLRKDYSIRKIRLITECGSEKIPQLPFFYALAGNIVAQTFGAVSYATGGETVFSIDSLMYDGESIFKITLTIDAVLLLFTVCVTVAKILLRKIEEWIRKTK